MIYGSNRTLSLLDQQNLICSLDYCQDFARQTTPSCCTVIYGCLMAVERIQTCVTLTLTEMGANEVNHVITKASMRLTV